jgi:hypothetical protein
MSFGKILSQGMYSLSLSLFVPLFLLLEIGSVCGLLGPSFEGDHNKLAKS